MAARRGFALLSAVWFVVVLGGLGLYLAASGRDARLVTANRLELATARAAAEGGVEHARARIASWLGSGGRGQPFALVLDERTGVWLARDTFALDAVRYRVYLRDPSAALHLNQASEDELRALLIALRVDAGRADRVAQAIADWRDADDLPRLRGAERDTYLRFAARSTPRNGPFAALNELLDVREVDAALLALLAPHLTLRGGGLVNPNTASAPVLQSVPGFGTEAVAQIIRLRDSGVIINSVEQLLAALPVGTRNRLLDQSGAWRSRLVFSTVELEFLAEAWPEGSPVRVRLGGTFVAAGAQVVTVGSRFE